MSKVVRFMVDGYDGRPIDLYLSMEATNELLASVKDLKMLQNGVLKLKTNDGHEVVLDMTAHMWDAQLRENFYVQVIMFDGKKIPSNDKVCITL